MRRGLLTWISAALLCASVARAQEAASDETLLQALSDPSFKVRAQAAVLIGKRGVAAAIPRLLERLQDDNLAVRAAAALSLGKLKAETARPALAVLLGQPAGLVPEAAEKALRLLDEARGQPRFFVVIEPVAVADGLSQSGLAPLQEALRKKLGKRAEIVLAAGEERSLSGERLLAHLAQRKLAGISLRPRLLVREIARRGGAHQARCKLSVVTASLVKNRMEFAGNGEAAAELESPPSDDERAEIEAMLFEAAAGAALDQVIGYLGRRTD